VWGRKERSAAAAALFFVASHASGARMGTSRFGGGGSGRSPHVRGNMRKRHSSHSWISPAARTAVKGARSLCVHRSGAETLDGHRSGGYAASAAPVPFATAQNSKPRHFCMIPFATASVPNATLQGVECHSTPDAVGGVLVALNVPLLFTDVNTARPPEIPQFLSPSAVL
jgi:hypothetical protein